MRKLFAVVTLIVIYCNPAICQDFKYCGNPQKEKELIAADPSIVIYQAELNQFVHDWILSHSAHTRDDDMYIIPLVFNVIHDYGTENISDDQINDAVRILNLDYRKMNADTSLIVDQFKNIIGDAKVEFRLANKAPDGTCTNGIEHIHSLHTYAGDDDGKLGYWPRSNYLNVWTVRSFDDEIGGYAYLPADVNTSVKAPNDGVIILSSYVGSIGTGNAVTSRALTHEAGHSLGLLHPWGQSNTPGVDCGDDNIGDTPETAGWTSCNLSGIYCNTGIVENVQNFMEYSYCSEMFTDDQVLAMQAVLNSSTAQRNNLWADDNLIATGTEDTIRTPCAPKADFYAASRMTCIGTSISFHDISSNGTVASRSWTFQDGTPATSPDKDPAVAFNSPGWKTITLEVSNDQGSDATTQTSYVYVSDDAAVHSPGFFEGFEDPNAFMNEWVVFNPEGNSSKFSRITTTGYNSSSCVKLNNDNNMNGDRDQLVSPSYDLSSGGSLFLNFRYSCASGSSATANINDALTIYSSTDCGKTWLMRTTIVKSTLANVGFVSASFTPTSSAQWVGKTVLLPSSLFQPNVRFKFEYKTNGFGNNFFIDDINVSNYPVGIDDPDASLFDLNIFPNPVSNGSAAIVNLQSGTNVSVRIFDMQGKIVSVLYNDWLSEGEHHFDLDASHLNSNGMYLLLVDDGLTVQQKKFVVQ